MLVRLTRIPVRLVSEANEEKHWRVRWKRRKQQRMTTYQWMRQWMPTSPPLPLTITMIRIAPRQLDSDNLPTSCKAIQDGIADWLDGAPGQGQDRKEGLTWRYCQRKGATREYAVEIMIESP